MQLFDSGRYYEVTPDAKHFLLIQNAQPVSPVAELNLVLGWGRRARTADAREAGPVTLPPLAGLRH